MPRIDPAAAVDRGWMQQALALAALGEGTTSPNPRVGCVIVAGARVVGRGFHRAAGGPHAEDEALREAGSAARSATAYVNLEPCAHHGHTPPCAQRLAMAGVARVVAAVADPNPLVDGRGFAALRAAGITVDAGVLGAEATELNAPFFHWHRTARPLVTLKAALSVDGMIAAAHGQSRWISGPAARGVAHRLRLTHDAVLVGAGTIRRDDPRLTVRLPDRPTPARVRAIVSSAADLDPRAAVFAVADAPPPIVYCCTAAPARRARLDACGEVVTCGSRGDELALDELLLDLGRRGVQSLLVEGGGRTLAAFLRQGCGDRGALFVADQLIGSVGGTALLARRAAASPAAAWRVAVRSEIPLGPERLIRGSLVPPAE